MPTAYTLIPRPKNLFATATLIHRLRHPLRIQRTRYTSLILSHSPSAHTGEDKRHPRVEDEWIEAPTRSGSLYRLAEIEDKGEYNEQRYGKVDLYWNSVMVEAGEEEQAKRRLGEEKRKRRQGRGKGRVFEDSEQLQRAARDYGKGKNADVSGQQIHSSKEYAESRVSSGPRNSLLDRSSIKQSFEGVVDPVSNQPVHLYRKTNADANDDRYMKLKENTIEAELPNVDSDHDTNLILTWNSTLDRILASPHVDAETEATIRARARGRSIERDKRTSNPPVDMRMVRMVPNFSYPIAGARWCERSDMNSRRVTNDNEHQEAHPTTSQSTQEHYQTGPNSTDSSTPTTVFQCSPSPYSSSSLYRAPTPPATAEHDSHSALPDILDLEELSMYRAIVMHDPRFTILLADAQALSRQVSLMAKHHIY